MVTLILHWGQSSQYLSKLSRLLSVRSLLSFTIRTQHYTRCAALPVLSESNMDGVMGREESRSTRSKVDAVIAQVGGLGQHANSSRSVASSFGGPMLAANTQYISRALHATKCTLSVVPHFRGSTPA